MTSTSPAREARLQRETKETTVDVSLRVDGTGVTTISTGIPFFDHMLSQLGRHGGFDRWHDHSGSLVYFFYVLFESKRARGQLVSGFFYCWTRQRWNAPAFAF